jgi:hypothetical protein
MNKKNLLQMPPDRTKALELEKYLTKAYTIMQRPPVDVFAYSIISQFRESFGDNVNKALSRLKIWELGSYYFLFSQFLEPGNVWEDSEALFSVGQLDYIIEVNEMKSSQDIEHLICNKFDMESLALFGLGGSYLLRPEIEKHIQYYGTLKGLKLSV